MQSAHRDEANDRAEDGVEEQFAGPERRLLGRSDLLLVTRMLRLRGACLQHTDKLVDDKQCRHSPRMANTKKNATNSCGHITTGNQQLAHEDSQLT